MIETYLFDWGNTLMRDFPGSKGKMCDWDVVEATEGAKDTLIYLSNKFEVYVATGAADSSVAEIEKAFERVGLNKYICGYFCQSNLGVSKDSAEFYPKILGKLNKSATTVAMVGDSLVKDIVPASKVGIKTIWLTSVLSGHPNNTKVIRNLRELCV